jgi:nicotinate-nucleotide adenylyltransferase
MTVKKKAAPRSGKLRLGIYGGTFDPVHHGHLLLARDALEQLKLDAVLFVAFALRTRSSRAVIRLRHRT